MKQREVLVTQQTKNANRRSLRFIKLPVLEDVTWKTNLRYWDTSSAQKWHLIIGQVHNLIAGYIGEKTMHITCMFFLYEAIL